MDTTRADLRAEEINRGIGIGFLIGMAAGALLLPRRR